MKTSNSIGIFKCLGDKTRLNIINLLFEEPMYVELLSETLNLAASTVSFHLKKLESVGLVYVQKEQYYSIYKLNHELIKESIKNLVLDCYDDEDDLKGRMLEFENKVIKSFFRQGVLIKIPVQRKKRYVVLKKVTEKLDKDKNYTEKELNKVINEYFSDHCTLRRWLIEDGLFTRKDQIYKKL